MVHPLMNRSGRSYERTAIIDWITNKHGPSCPVTKEPLYVKDLLPNTRLRNEIIAWYEAQGDDTSSYHVDDESVREVEVMRALNVALSPQKKPKKNVLRLFAASTTSPRKAIA